MIVGIGSDLIDIRRVEKSLERFGERFIVRQRNSRLGGEFVAFGIIIEALSVQNGQLTDAGRKIRKTLD